MAQVVVYGHRAALTRRRSAISDAIHGAIVSALEYPESKRFQRFIPLEPEDFLHPEDPGDDYTIVEISMFEGRTEAARRALISELFARLESDAGLAPHSVEITVTETSRVNWGIRGRNAADLDLDYIVEV